MSSSGEDVPPEEPAPAVEEESSSWDLSSSEAASADGPSKSSAAEEESSDWDMSSEAEESAKPAPAVEEESSSWGFFVGSGQRSTT